MKALDVVRQLYAVLPTATTLFSETVSITSLTYAGGLVTATTSAAHGLATNDYVTVTGAKTPLAISSLTSAAGVATAITASAHDLTEGWENGAPATTPSIEVSGATEVEYNGSHALLSVPNRTHFTYSITGSPASPATGSPVLLQNFVSGYNGRQQVTVVDATHFTYPSSAALGSPAQGTIVAHTGLRISRAVDLQAAQDAYTAQGANQLWGFVVLSDTAVSKDRRVESDATATMGDGTAFRQRMGKGFTIYVFVPSTGEYVGGGARDLMEDLEAPLFKSLLRVKFSEGLTSEQVYSVVFTGHQFVAYTGAYYIHQFIFETVSDIIYQDTVAPDYSVAFRDINMDFLNSFGVADLVADVNLDEVP